MDIEWAMTIMFGQESQMCKTTANQGFTPLPVEVLMSKLISTDGAIIFAALKLIEQLYHDGEIPAHILRNAIREYGDVVDVSSFECFSKGDSKEKE